MRCPHALPRKFIKLLRIRRRFLQSVFFKTILIDCGSFLAILENLCASKVSCVELQNLFWLIWHGTAQRSLRFSNISQLWKTSLFKSVNFDGFSDKSMETTIWLLESFLIKIEVLGHSEKNSFKKLFESKVMIKRFVDVSCYLNVVAIFL